MCSFKNINERDGVWNTKADLKTVRYIRRASLDVLWSQETNTVKGNCQRMQRNWQSTQEDLTIGSVVPKMGHPEMMIRHGACSRY